MNPTSMMALIGFGPAIILLYFVLGEFEGFFIDNKAFFMITFGLLIGLILGIFSLYLPLGDFLWALTLIFLIELIKFVILLQKPFRLKHDATFYGMALGIGIGAMMIFIYGFYAGLTHLELKTILFLLLLSYNYNLLHGSTGALIGYGCYIGDFWKYFFRAFLISGAHGLLMSVIWGTSFDKSGAETKMFALLIIGGVYATVVLLYIYKEIIPKTIPDELKRAKESVGENVY